MHQQALGIHQDMPFLPIALLAGIVSGGIDVRATFFSALTLWLSMTQAVGLACRSLSSRHFW
jgi:hypothetical protein